MDIKKDIIERQWAMAILENDIDAIAGFMKRNHGINDSNAWMVKASADSLREAGREDIIYGK